MAIEPVDVGLYNMRLNNSNLMMGAVLSRRRRLDKVFTNSWLMNHRTLSFY